MTSDPSRVEEGDSSPHLAAAGVETGNKRNEGQDRRRRLWQVLKLVALVLLVHVATTRHTSLSIYQLSNFRAAVALAAKNNKSLSSLDAAISVSVNALAPAPAPCPLYSNVVLVGQFNWNTAPDLVEHWVKRWREVFGIVHVRGPFSEENMASLVQRGIPAFGIAADEGYYSPMKTLADTLLLFHNDSSIEGVIMAHDDLLFNVTHLETLGFPSNSSTLSEGFPHIIAKPYLSFSTSDSTTFQQYAGKRRKIELPADGVYKYDGKLAPWRWWPECIGNFARAAAAQNDTSRFDFSFQNNSVIYMYANSPGDFAYVPTRFAHEFASMAHWLVDAKVFLECGMPTIMGHLQQRYHVQHHYVQICTKIQRNRTEYKAWVPSCARGIPITDWIHHPQKVDMSPPYGLYHPVKLSMYNNLSLWDETFNLVTEMHRKPPSSARSSDGQPALCTTEPG